MLSHHHRTLAFLIHHRTLAAAILLQCAFALALGGCCSGTDETTDNNTVVLDVIESSANAESLEAPDYAFDASGLTVKTDVDNIVQSVGGSAKLTAGLVPGQRYVVVDAAGLGTYAQLDGAYLGGEQHAVLPTISGANFGLIGDNLSTLQKRTLIIASETSSARSYQAFEITFHANP